MTCLELNLLYYTLASPKVPSGSTYLPHLVLPDRLGEEGPPGAELGQLQEGGAVGGEEAGEGAREAHRDQGDHHAGSQGNFMSKTVGVCVWGGGQVFLGICGNLGLSVLT